MARGRSGRALTTTARKREPNSEEMMHPLPLLSPLASLLWRLSPPCLSHQHWGGCACPDPATTKTWSRLCCCMFLPAPVPPILATSSSSRVPFQLPLQAAFQIDRLRPWLCVRHLLWGRDGGDLSSHAGAAAGRTGSLVPKLLPFPCVRGKRANLPCSKCRDRGDPFASCL